MHDVIFTTPCLNIIRFINERFIFQSSFQFRIFYYLRFEYNIAVGDGFLDFFKKEGDFLINAGGIERFDNGTVHAFLVDWTDVKLVVALAQNVSIMDD